MAAGISPAAISFGIRNNSGKSHEYAQAIGVTQGSKGGKLETKRLPFKSFLVWSFEFVSDLKARPLLHSRYGGIRISKLSGKKNSCVE
jgi:hypothetical protein